MESCKQYESAARLWLPALGAAVGSVLLVFVPSNVWLTAGETAAPGAQLGAYFLKQILTVLLLLIVPALWARTAHVGSPWLLPCLAGVTVGFGMILFADLGDALYAAMPVVIPGAGLYVLQRLKLSNFRAVLYESVLVLIGLFGLVCLKDLIVHGDAYLPFRRVAELYGRVTEEMLRAASPLESGMTALLNDLETMIDWYRVNAEQICVPVLMVPAMGAGLAGTLLSHRMNRRGGAALPALPRFEDWRCERWYVIGVAGFSIVSMLLRLADVQSGYALSGVAEIAWRMPCSLAGLAAVRRLSRRANKKWPFAVTCAALVLLPAVMLIILTLLGMLSSLRKRTNVGEDGIRK